MEPLKIYTGNMVSNSTPYCKNAKNSFSVLHPFHNLTSVIWVTTNNFSRLTHKLPSMLLDKITIYAEIDVWTWTDVTGAYST
mgnify:CR=1 FL=1